jgi:hypothetical protein
MRRALAAAFGPAAELPTTVIRFLADVFVCALLMFIGWHAREGFSNTTY